MLHYNKLRALLCRVFPNYISFTTSLTSASQKKTIMRILCQQALHRPIHVLHKTRQCDSVTDLPFDQMEPSGSMQTRSGNPVRTPKSEQDFPDF